MPSNENFDELFRKEKEDAEKSKGLDNLLGAVLEAESNSEKDLNPEFSDIREQFGLFVESPDLKSKLLEKGLLTPQFQQKLETPLESIDSPKWRMIEALFSTLTSEQITELFGEFLVEEKYTKDIASANKVAKEYVTLFGSGEID